MQDADVASNTSPDDPGASPMFLSTTDRTPTRRFQLRTDTARLTSGRFAAIQVDLGPARRAFVVATSEETARGWIPADGRTVYPGLHPAFDDAHRSAIADRRLLQAA
ncbi:MAG TPA: hypothetical protein VIV06_06440 [Candidatus Limnocylindrales bacterium]